MVDADGASRFEDLELLWKALDELSTDKDAASIAVGSRAHLVKTEAVVKVRLEAVCSLFVAHVKHAAVRTA